MTEATDVVIVGAGPVGLVLALMLDRHGVDCVIIHDGLTTADIPRGSTHNARTMEHYRRLGIAADVRDLGLPVDHPTDVAYFTRYSAFELARLTMPSAADVRRAVAESAKTDQTPEPLHRANQMYVERLLLERARRKPRITLRLGCTATAVRQDDTGVTTDTDRGTLRSRYLVGCDGSESVVRAAIGASYRGDGPLDQNVLGRAATASHLRIPTLCRDYLGGRRAWSYWAVNGELVTNLISLNGKDEFVLLTSSADPGGVPALVRRAAGVDLEVEVMGHRPWTPGLALIADRFADRRIAIAGDAAHLFTPTGGFGMNTGIDDVANLSWKIGAMVAGWGGEGLLDSYEIERRPIAARNTAAARRLNRNLGAFAFTDRLEEASADGAGERDRVGALLSTFGEQFASIGVQLGARYDDSPLTAGGGEPPPDTTASYQPSSVPGGRAPHAWLTRSRRHGDSLFDVLGPAFTLLRLGSRPPETSGLEGAAARAGVPLVVRTVADAEVRDLYERDVVLIRPDQHVAWRGNAVPDDASELIDRVIGRVRQHSE